MAALDSLIEARDNLAARIAEVTASSQPDYTEAGRTMNKGTYLTQLCDQLEKLDAAIARASGPYEIVTRGVT